MSASAAPVDDPNAVIAQRPGLAARLRALLLGLSFTAAGAFVLAAVFSHDPFDPSWNAATSGPVSNIAGAPGAITADLTLQLMGWAGPAAALALLAGVDLARWFGDGRGEVVQLAWFAWGPLAYAAPAMLLGLRRSATSLCARRAHAPSPAGRDPAADA